MPLTSVSQWTLFVFQWDPIHPPKNTNTGSSYLNIKISLFKMVRPWWLHGWASPARHYRTAIRRSCPRIEPLPGWWSPSPPREYLHSTMWLQLSRNRTSAKLMVSLAAAWILTDYNTVTTSVADLCKFLNGSRNHNLLLFEGTFTSFFKYKKSYRSPKSDKTVRQELVFFLLFCFMIEGSGSVSPTNGSGSGRPKTYGSYGTATLVKTVRELNNCPTGLLPVL